MKVLHNSTYDTVSLMRAYNQEIESPKKGAYGRKFKAVIVRVSGDRYKVLRLCYFFGVNLNRVGGRILSQREIKPLQNAYRNFQTAQSRIAEAKTDLNSMNSPEVQRNFNRFDRQLNRLENRCKTACLTDLNNLEKEVFSLLNQVVKYVEQNSTLITKYQKEEFNELRKEIKEAGKVVGELKKKQDFIHEFLGTRFMQRYPVAWNVGEQGDILEFQVKNKERSGSTQLIRCDMQSYLSTHLNLLDRSTIEALEDCLQKLELRLTTKKKRDLPQKLTSVNIKGFPVIIDWERHEYGVAPVTTSIKRRCSLEDLQKEAKKIIFAKVVLGDIFSTLYPDAWSYGQKEAITVDLPRGSQSNQVSCKLDDYLVRHLNLDNNLTITNLEKALRKLQGQLVGKQDKALPEKLIIRSFLPRTLASEKFQGVDGNLITVFINPNKKVEGLFEYETFYPSREIEEGACQAVREKVENTQDLYENPEKILEAASSLGSPPTDSGSESPSSLGSESSLWQQEVLTHTPF